MVTLSRIVLALLSVLLLAKVLPEYAARMFPKDYEAVYVSYSADQDRLVLERFRSGNRSYSDTEGNPLTEDEMRLALPFSNLNYLDKTGQLPETVAGWPLDVEAVFRAGARMRHHPFSLDQAHFGLYTLLESERDVEGRLLTPPDMFRMNTRMEFILAATNAVDEAKTTQFTTALQQEGFVFPAHMVADSPSTRKPYDNGALLVDAQRRVFHIWQIQGQPKVVRTPVVLPDDALQIHVLEQTRREYHGVYALPDRLVLLDWQNYAETPIPLQDYRPDRDFFAGDADPLNWQFSHAAERSGFKQVVVTDPQLQPLHRYTWHQGEEDQRKRRVQANVMGFLFPFQVEFNVRERTQRGLHFSLSQALWWLTLAGIVSAWCAYVGWNWWRWRRMPHWLDSAFVALTGWPGAISLTMLGPLAVRRRRMNA